MKYTIKRLIINSLIALILIVSGISFSANPVSAVAPSVSTLACTGFSGSTAIINAQLTNLNGGGAITSHGFDYGLTVAYGSSVTVGTSLAVGSKYWANLTGLTAGTVYHYRAKTYNGTDWGYGGDMTFSTLGAPFTSTTATTATTTTTGGFTSIGTKNPPSDADKSLYLNSAAGDAIVTSTWSQVKAFLKTYFDTVYSAYGATGNVTANGATGYLGQFSTATNITNSIATGNSTFITVSGGIQANSAQINGTANVVGDVTFNNYKAIAMACDNGATLPASPVVGQWFLHTPTGRSILYQYVGSWIPMFSYGSMVVYVDGTNGTDSLNNGTSTGASAFKTVQYAINSIPPTYSGNVTINITADTFAENVIIRGKLPSANYSISLIGTLTVHDNIIMDGNGAQGSGATQASVHEHGMTTNHYQNQILKFTSGTNNGAYRIIDSNSNDAGTANIVLAGLALPAQPLTNDTATVYNWGTTIQRIYCYGVTVNISNIKTTTQHGIMSSDYANVSATVCYATAGNYGFYANNYSSMTLTNVLLTNDTAAALVLISVENNSVINIYGGKARGVAAQTLLAVANHSSLFFWYGFVLDTCNLGIYLLNGGYVRTYAIGNVYHIIKNCTTYGIRAAALSFCTDTSTNQYSANGTNESADAATFSYVD